MRKEGGIFVDIGVVGYGGAVELGVRPVAGGTGFLVTILIWQIEVVDWRLRLALKPQNGSSYCSRSISSLGCSAAVVRGLSLEESTIRARARA